MAQARLFDVAAVVLPMNETATAIQTPSQSRLNNNQPSRTPGPHIQGLAPSVCMFLTRVSGNEAGDCPHSESDDEEETRPKAFIQIPWFLTSLGHTMHVLMTMKTLCSSMKKTVI
jgi:hypothetical protein